MSKHETLQFYAVTPLWLWPILWWQLVCLQRTFARLEAEGYTDIFYAWDAAALRFTISHVSKPVAADPLAARTPSLKFIYALAGYMPETLWALHFNSVPLFRNMARGIGKVRIAPHAILEPG